MKWRPWVKNDVEHEVKDEDLQEAREARTTAEHDLRKIRGQRSEVEKIADKLREIRKANHLVEIFEESLKRRKPTHE